MKFLVIDPPCPPSISGPDDQGGILRKISTQPFLSKCRCLEVKKKKACQVVTTRKERLRPPPPPRTVTYNIRAARI